MTSTCARKGCSNPLPKLAIDHADSYCSNACCREAHGIDFKSAGGTRRVWRNKANRGAA
jgi:hypothetical protein